jgi:hypothetical protein
VSSAAESSLFEALTQLPPDLQRSLPDHPTKVFSVEVLGWSLSLCFRYTEQEGDLYLVVESITHSDFGTLQPDHHQELFAQVERLLEERLSSIE